MLSRVTIRPGKSRKPWVGVSQARRHRGEGGGCRGRTGGVAVHGHGEMPARPGRVRSKRGNHGAGGAIEERVVKHPGQDHGNAGEEDVTKPEDGEAGLRGVPESRLDAVQEVGKLEDHGDLRAGEHVHRPELERARGRRREGER